MLWIKNNKLLKTAKNKIIDCVDCPCAMFGVYGYKYRYLNENLQPYNQCAWNFDLEVKKLSSLTFTPLFLYSDTITVSEGTGLVASGKGSFDCYEQWIDQDENGNPIYDTYCDHIQYEVYCLLFQKNNIQFNFELQYPVPSLTPDSSTGLYAETFYSDGDLTSAGRTAQNYWRDLFISQYSISFDTTVYNGDQKWYFDVTSMKRDQDFIQQGFESIVIRQTGNNGGSTLDHFEVPVQSKDIMDLTCSQMVLACATNTSQLVSYVQGKVNDRSQYWKYSQCIQQYKYNCNKSNYLCLNVGDIEGYCWDNFYCSQLTCSYRFNSRKFVIKKNENTKTDAIGVVFDCQITHETWDDNNKDQTYVKTENTSEISIQFDKQYDQFPLPSNVTWMRYISFPNCDADNPYDYGSGDLWVIPDYQAPRYCGAQVHGESCREKYSIRLIAKRYL